MSSQDKVYLAILREISTIISNDRLKNGDKLPSERELSERLQVGRSSVREALRALEFLDLIETRRGEGTFIKKADGQRLSEIMASFILRDKKARKDLTETRKMIEVEAVRLAAGRIKQAQLTKLNQLIEESKGEWEKGIIPVEQDYLFHKTIIESSHNRLLLYIWLPLVEYSKTAIEQSLSREGRPPASIAEHEEIYQALMNKDEGRALAALLNHLEKSRF